MMMTFDPSVYDRSKIDFQREPNLSDEEWCARFVASMVADAEAGAASSDFLPEVPKYAAETAKAYLPDRREYVSPEEAADTDISYWESEE